MTLNQILNSLCDITDDTCIFARKPWSGDSEATTSLLTEDYKTPKDVSQNNLEYFLEVDVAKEILRSLDDKFVSEEEVTALLIFYAENDAYPT